MVRDRRPVHLSHRYLWFVTDDLSICHVHVAFVFCSLRTCTCATMHLQAMTERFWTRVEGGQRGHPPVERCPRALRPGVHSTSRDLNRQRSQPRAAQVGKPSAPRHGAQRVVARERQRARQSRWYRGDIRPWAQARGRFLFAGWKGERNGNVRRPQGN